MEILENVSIADATTFKIGGRVRYCLKPSSTSELYNALSFIKKKNIPYFIIGQGSNVLIGSKDFDGAVILTLNMNAVSIRGNTIIAEAGLTNTRMSIFGLINGIKNFDFLYGMPGTLGGSALMNARAFGISMSDIVLEVKCIDQDMGWKTIPIKDIEYGYKKSIFQDSKYVIAEVLLRAEKGERREIKKKMRRNKESRLKTKQYDYPSAGCIFKNDYELGISTGKLIDDIGLKGMSHGSLEISKHHGNFIINKGNASSDEVISLIKHIKDEVKRQKNISIDCEIKFLGNL